jgi:hypothetical protein
VVALLLATLVGCGLPVPTSTGGGGPTPVPTGASFTEDTSMPPTEGPQALTTSADNGNGNGSTGDPYVVVPTMPAGGGEDTPTGVREGVHCLQASKLAGGAVAGCSVGRRATPSRWRSTRC